jgi:hypothetical protein
MVFWITGGIIAGALTGWLIRYRKSRFFGMIRGIGIGAFTGLLLTILHLFIKLWLKF